MTVPVPGGFLGGQEMWIVLALALLFFGATRLPGIARSMGKSVNEFKAGMREGSGTARIEDGESKGGGDPAKN